MEPLHIIAMISFVSGAFGYIIFQFWIRPILGYRRIKHRIAAALTHFSDAKPSEDAVGSGQKQTDERRASIRKDSVGLTDCFNYDLPRWYRMVLQQRGEDPVEASRHLMTLSNTPESKSTAKQVKAVKEQLLIK